MSTPPMLKSPSATPIRPARGLLVFVTVALLALVATGLVAAGILAVYDWRTPEIEAPIVAAIAVCFGLALVINIAAAAGRHARTGG